MTEKKQRFKQLTGKGFTHAFIDMKNPNISYCCDNEIDCKNIVNLLNTLNNENEQLKQRNDKQYNQLKQLWELIEDEDYNTLRSMLNQRETDEKLLQKEWGTYSD